MTTVETLTRQDRDGLSWNETVARLAGLLARQDFPPGDLAALRRMSPGGGQDAAVFWRLAARYDLLGGPVIERKWALIIHGIALMTSTSGQDGPGGSAHDPSTSVGKSLFLGAENSSRASGFYSELRLNRLLNAHGDMLPALLARMFRMLASSGVTFDWREMARFILLEGWDESGAEEARRRFARDYYRAEREVERSAAE